MRGPSAARAEVQIFGGAGDLGAYDFSGAAPLSGRQKRERLDGEAMPATRRGPRCIREAAPAPEPVVDCLKVSLRENLDHLRCLASANQWRRADFGNDGQGIGATGT